MHCVCVCLSHSSELISLFSSVFICFICFHRVSSASFTMSKRQKTNYGFTILSLYESESDDTSESEIATSDVPTTKRRQRKRQRSWNPEAQFETPEEALAKVDSEKVWSKDHTNSTKDGKKVYYRCINVKRRGPQCNAGIFLLYNATSLRVDLYRAVSDHSCPEAGTSLLTLEMKKEIESLYQLSR